MNQHQRNYSAALAAHTAAYAAFRADVAAKLPAEPEDCDSPEWDAWMDREEAIRAEHRVDELRSALVAAEDALVLWSLKVARKTASADRSALLDLNALEERRHLPSISRRLVDLAMRLDVAA